MRLSESRHTDHEKDVFKAIHSAGPNVTNGSSVVLAKRAVMPRRMVMAKDHSVIGPLYRQLMGELDLAKRNSHGGVTGAEAHGPKSLQHTDPPTRRDANSRQVSRKKKLVQANGHHGAIPAGKETYAIGTPRTTEVMDAATHAPGHVTYVREPPHQLTQTKTHGAYDDLHKLEEVVRRAHQRPMSAEELATLPATKVGLGH